MRHSSYERLCTRKFRPVVLAVVVKVTQPQEGRFSREGAQPAERLDWTTAISASVAANSDVLVMRSSKRLRQGC